MVLDDGADYRTVIRDSLQQHNLTDVFRLPLFLIMKLWWAMLNQWQNPAQFTVDHVLQLLCLHFYSLFTNAHGIAFWLQMLETCGQFWQLLYNIIGSKFFQLETKKSGSKLNLNLKQNFRSFDIHGQPATNAEDAKQPTERKSADTTIHTSCKQIASWQFLTPECWLMHGDLLLMGLDPKCLRRCTSVGRKL